MCELEMSDTAVRLKQQLTNIVSGLLTLDQDPNFEQQFGFDITRELRLIIEEGLDVALEASKEDWNAITDTMQQTVLETAKIYYRSFQELLEQPLSENPLEDEICEVHYAIACEQKLKDLITILTT